MVRVCMCVCDTGDGNRSCGTPNSLSLSSPPEENPAWLPLYGSVCCRLAAQPLCMTQPTASGTLRVQVRAPVEDRGEVGGSWTT